MTAQLADNVHPLPTVDTAAAPQDSLLRRRITHVIDQLERGTADRDPLAVLEKWSVPEADRQGYLDGLSTASRAMFNALRSVPEADGAMEDTVEIGDFMRVMEQTVRTVPTTDITPEERVLRARLVLEEALEFVAAMGCEVTAGQIVVDKSNVEVEIDPAKDIDLVEATDALADITVVTKGSAHTLGVPVDAAFRIVNETNNAKAPGGVLIRRADGKVLKPEGWQPPTEKLRELLLAHGADPAIVAP